MNILDRFTFEKEKHVKYFNYLLKGLSHHYKGYDTSRMTIAYFCVGSLDILNSLDSIKNKEDIINWIYSLQIVPSKEESEDLVDNSGLS
jgi:geranylgeranyl transferase type-1 subunit beta